MIPNFHSLEYHDDFMLNDLGYYTCHFCLNNKHHLGIQIKNKRIGDLVNMGLFIGFSNLKWFIMLNQNDIP